MRFITFAGLLSICSIANAQLGADQIAANLDEISTIERGVIGSIAFFKPSNLLTESPKALNGLREIIRLISDDVKALSEGGVQTQYSDEDQQKICNSLRGFTVSTKTLIYYTQSHRRLLLGTSFYDPFNELFNLVHDGYDELTKQVIATVPTCAADEQNAVKDVDESFSNFLSILL